MSPEKPAAPTRALRPVEAEHQFVLTETDGLPVSSREPVEPEDVVSVVRVLEKR